MRLRICCCSCTNERPAKSNGTTLPRVVAEQPKLRRSIQTANESAVQRKGDKEVAQQEVVSDKRFSDTEPAADTQFKEPCTQNDTASVTASVPKSDGKKVEKSIPQAARMSDDGVEAQRNEVGRVTAEQSQSTVTFNVIAPGHFHSVHKGVEYHIVNGDIQSISGACDESGKEFIMAQYASAMEGLEKGLLGMERQVSAPQPAGPNVHSILASLHHPPRPPSPPRRANRNMTKEDFVELLNRMRDEVRKEEENKARDTIDSVNELGGYISEPTISSRPR